MSKVRETSWTYSAAACAGAAASRIARLTTISTMKFTASATMRRIDVLFEIERTVNGKTPEQRLAARREKSRRLVIELEIWMRQQRALLSSSNDTAKAINYLLNRWTAFTRFLDDGRVCLSNNAAE